jgi:hypothetical protein
MSFRDTVNKAATKAGLSLKMTVAANGYLLLAHTMLEHGKIKLPHGGLAILSEVAKDHIGHTIPTGSLRWYKTTMLKDMETAGKIVALPKGFETLVRESAIA